MSAHDLRCEAVAVGRLLQILREEGIVEGEDDALLAAASESNLMEAADDVLRCLGKLEAQQKAVGALIDEYRARKQVLAERAERLKGALADAMQTSGFKKLPLALGTVTVSNAPPAVQIVDEALLPLEFWRVPDPVPDKKAIAEALKAGEVPGACWGNGGLKISVRTK